MSTRSTGSTQLRKLPVGPWSARQWGGLLVVGMLLAVMTALFVPGHTAHAAPQLQATGIFMQVTLPNSTTIKGPVTVKGYAEQIELTGVDFGGTLRPPSAIPPSVQLSTLSFTESSGYYSAQVFSAMTQVQKLKVVITWVQSAGPVQQMTLSGCYITSIDESTTGGSESDHVSLQFGSIQYQTWKFSATGTVSKGPSFSYTIPA